MAEKSINNSIPSNDDDARGSIEMGDGFCSGIRIDHSTGRGRYLYLNLPVMIQCFITFIWTQVSIFYNQQFPSLITTSYCLDVLSDLGSIPKVSFFLLCALFSLVHVV